MDSTNEYYRMLNALSKIYISIYTFDLKKDIEYPFKSNEYIDMWSKNVEGAQNKTYNTMKNLTEEKHVDMMLEFVNLSTLDERMKGKSDIAIVFKGKINGWCRARFIAIDYDEDGSLHNVVYTVECIDEEKRKENYLMYLSQTDLMTSLYNRGYGEQSIKELLDKEKKGLFCLFDVDKFKSVNDKYGHDIGDKVLIAIAVAMKKAQREDDISMRLGGDEFAMYFRNIDTDEDAKLVIERLFSEIEKIHVDPMEEQIHISLGASFYKKDMNFDMLYKIADIGVYESKKSLGNRMTIVENDIIL